MSIDQSPHILKATESESVLDVFTVGQITGTFNAQKGVPQQALTLDQLYQTAEKTTEILRRSILEKTLDLTDIQQVKIGNVKDRDHAKDKILTKYDGEGRFINDIVRGMITVDTGGELVQLDTLLSDPDSELLKGTGIFVVDSSDHFETPIDYTHYRCKQYKLAIPTELGEPHIVELQIVSSGIEAVYDLTHPYKRAAEDIFTKAKQEGRAELTEEEQESVARNYAVCQYFNSKMAHKDGFDYALRDKDKYGFSEERQDALSPYVTLEGLEL
ncbi:MAG: hypothetical protein ACRBDI_07625 [Alphaproteobacteria bacterium]